MLSNYISLEKDKLAETVAVFGSFIILNKPEIVNPSKEAELIINAIFGVSAGAIGAYDIVGSIDILSYEPASLEIIKELFLSNSELNSEIFNQPETKKEIMQDIMANDLDIMDVSEELILERLPFLPKTRRLYSLLFLTIFQNEFSEEITKLSSRVKKTILCSLLGLSFVGNDIDLETYAYLLQLAEIFEIEPEYLEEFVEPVKSIHFAKLELDELINE